MNSTTDQGETAAVRGLDGERDQASSWLRRVYWLPLPLFAIAIAILASLHIEKLYSSSALFTTLNLLFLTLVSLVVSFLAARSFLAKQSWAILFLGMGALALALGAALAALKAGGPGANPVASVYNSSACLAGICHLTGATLSLSIRPKRQRAGSPFLLTFYLVVAALVVIVALLVRANTWPVHFVQGSGPTGFGLAILRVTIGLFALSAVMFGINYRKDRSSFRYWYGLGLGLIVVGLVGVSLQKNLGDPLNWAGRLSQYAGGLYILLSVLPSLRSRAGRVLPLERALRESEGRYQSLVDHSPDAILVDVGGIYVFANQAAARLFGAESCDEVVGKSMADLTLTHPDERELVVQRVDQALDGREMLPRQITVLRLDGIPVEVEATGARVEFDGKPAIQVVMRDISDRTRVEAALRETNEYLDNLFNYANAPIIVWDPGFRITRFNRAFEVLTGRQAEAVIGESLEILFPKTEVASSMELIRKTLTGERWETVEIPIVHLHGSVRTVLWNSATLFAPDGVTPVATIAQGQDITERKRAEEQIEKALLDLERSNHDLEQFAYVASHDLQEPLRMVASYTALLAQRYEGQLDDKAQTFIHYAVDGATRMQRLINDLLTYSRVSTQGRPLQPTDSHAVLGEALRNLTVAIDENRAIISNDDLPTVRVDASQLQQVFQNLIANAIKFHGQTFPHVHVSAREEAGEWLFSVKDNGIGIDAQHADRLFIIFQRLHTRQEYPGTGIGLAVCKRIVERHGGRIWFESKPGKGSTFFFTLPT